MTLRYCNTCVYPETKPGLTLDGSGMCSGCRNQRSKSTIDWETRFRTLSDTLSRYRGGDNYDCLVPVSGGKDSHVQVHYIKNVLGMNPLCVTVAPQVETSIGRKNLENLKSQFRVDLLVLEPRRDVERRMTVSSFVERAWPNWAHDKLIYSWPLRIAEALKIKLVIMGENHDFESGGKDLGDGPSAARQMRHSLDSEVDLALLKRAGLTAGDVHPYISPTAEQLDAAGIEVLWLGYFVNWDSFDIYRIAYDLGFSPNPTTAAGHIDNYHGLDDGIVMVNAWLKFIKFGFGRVSDVAFNHISYGRMSREHAVKLVNEREGLLDPAIKHAWLDYTGVDEDTFDAVVASFANHKILAYRDGRWRLKNSAT